LLQAVAERLRQCISRPENCVRLGGDEFVLLETWPCECHGAELLAERVIAAVNQPVGIDGREVRVGVSIGIAVAPADAEAPAALMELADQAMYRAKRGGKNRYFYAAVAQDACTSSGVESAAAEA
ncbi:GGDEF domain-containing protein, partial [Falsiroseomonas sp.]|uniref:GGDEF domain-containing protein n=1 Tax=Falsiroseomonas sp. TaxID=2870721 RepID=UPI00272333A3